MKKLFDARLIGKCAFYQHNLKHSVLGHDNDTDGRFQFMNVMFDKITFIIANIYGTNNDDANSIKIYC